MADWLRFHFVIARRRYTGSSAPADSADCRFGDMARGREGGKEGGEGRGGEGEGRGGEGEGRGLSTLSTNQNLWHAGFLHGGGGRGEGRGLSTLSTNQNLCDRGA